MINELIDVSISTMIGNLPDIINRNNDAIENEFAQVFTYDSNGKNPKLTVDVDANTVTAQTGSFRNLNFSGQVLNASFVQKYNQVDASLVDMSQKIERIADELHIDFNTYGSASVRVQPVYGSSNSTNSNAARVYGKSAVAIGKDDNDINEEQQIYATHINQSADLSSFFSTTIQGKIEGLTAENLQYTALYRQLDNIRIPLSVGTVITGNGLSLMVYHDHITRTTVQRLYVPVATGKDGNSLVQTAPANTINLKS